MLKCKKLALAIDSAGVWVCISIECNSSFFLSLLFAICSTFKYFAFTCIA